MSVWVVLVFFTPLWLLSIILLLVIEVWWALYFQVTDPTTSVALGVIAIVDHCLHGGNTSRDTPE